MTYVSEWKSFMKPLVDAVARDKPDSKGLQGLAKNAGAVEKTLQAVDAALTKDDKNALKKGYQEFVNVSMRYNVFANTAAREIGDGKAPLDPYAAIVGMLPPQCETWRKEIKEAMTRLFSEGEMEPTYFSGDWQAAKKHFEAVTNKKKPSAGFLGPFRKSAGIDKTLKAIDAATAGNDLAALKKAVKEFEPAAKSYISTLIKAAAKEPPETTMKKETEGLQGTLQAILNRAKSTLVKAGG